LSAALNITLAASLFAQATAVIQISGVVSDAHGGVIPRAQVKATQTDTGLVRSSVTGIDGAYLLSNLPVGPYRLEAAAEGLTGEPALTAMGAAYNGLLDDRQVLQMQLQMWASACQDEEVRAVTRRRMSAVPPRSRRGP